MVNAQEWLDRSYPNKKQRWTVEEIDASNQNLSGDLDLIDFRSLKKLNIFGNPNLGNIISEIINTKLSNWGVSPFAIEAQGWLDWEYPNKKEVRKIELGEKEENIGGKLIISDSPQLEEIEIKGNFSGNKKELTHLQVNNCPQLNKLTCDYTMIKEFTIFDCPNLWELNIRGCDQLTDLDLSNVPNLEKLELLNNSKIVNLNLQNDINLRTLSISGTSLNHLDISHLAKLEELTICENKLTELDVRNCSNLKNLYCYKNYLTGLDLSQNLKLEKLDIGNNNFSEQDLFFLSHLVNLKELSLGNGNEDRSGKISRSASWDSRCSMGRYRNSEISQGIYNHFVGSLEPLQKMIKLESLNIKNTDLDKGVEYLPSSVNKIGCSSEVRLESKVKEIAWQLDLFASGKQKEWESLGFTREEIKQWLKVGLTASDYNFVAYLKNIKKLSPQQNNSEEVLFSYDKKKVGKLRKEYHSYTWRDIHSGFTPKLKKEWEDKGFTHEQARAWIKENFSILTGSGNLLKPQESNLAKYLQDKGIVPSSEEEYWKILKKSKTDAKIFFMWEINSFVDKLREEYYSIINKEKSESSPSKKEKLTSENEKDITEIGNWENIHPNFKKVKHYRPNYQQEWEELGFDYQEVQKIVDKGLLPYDGGLHLHYYWNREVDGLEVAYWLKTNNYQLSKLLMSDLILLKRRYVEEYLDNPQNWLDFWYPAKKRKKTTKLNIKYLKGDLIIDGKDGWENLEELNLSNIGPNITLNNLSKLKSIIAQYLGDKKEKKSVNLDINNCFRLQNIDFEYVCLVNLEEFFKKLNPESLISLKMMRNDSSLLSHDLSFLSRFRNLEKINLFDGKNVFYGSLEPLQRLTKLKKLNISLTNIDDGLEYLPDSLEIIVCDGETYSEYKYPVFKIEKKLQEYYSNIMHQYNFQAWKDHQHFFQQLAENLAKVNPNLTDVRNFLKEQNIFFNVRTNTFQGDLFGLTNLFNSFWQNQTFFEQILGQKELELLYLKTRIRVLKEKIIQAYLHFAPEQELLKELITAQIELVKFEKEEKSSSNYARECRKYKKRCEEIEDKLWEKNLEDIAMNKVQQILTDCKELVVWESELETKSLEYYKDINITYSLSQNTNNVQVGNVNIENSQIGNLLFGVGQIERITYPIKTNQSTKKIITPSRLPRFVQTEKTESKVSEPLPSTETLKETKLRELKEKQIQLENLLLDVAKKPGNIEYYLSLITDKDNGLLKLQEDFYNDSTSENKERLLKEKKEVLLNKLERKEIDKLCQLKISLIKLERQLKYLQSQQENKSKIVDWTNIHPFFTNQLINQWTSHNFTYQQTQEWAQVFGKAFNPQEVNFYVWLRDSKQLTAEEVLNRANLAQLREEYQSQQTRIQIPSK